MISASCLGFIPPFSNCICNVFHHSQITSWQQELTKALGIMLLHPIKKKNKYKFSSSGGILHISAKLQGGVFAKRHVD